MGENMNHKAIDSQNDIEQQKNGEYAVHRSRRSNIVAAVVCILLSLVVWVIIMDSGDSDYVAVRVAAPQEGYIYTLSVDFLEVEGTVGALRHADYIDVRIPKNAVPGVYRLTVDDLVLPDGVHLTADPDITLTIRTA